MHATLLTAALLCASPLAPLPTRISPVPAEARVRPADPAAPQSVRISLKLRDAAGLDALIAAQRDPASAQYRHWLTPAEFGERFGQSAADYQSLVEALGHAGLKTKTFHNRMYLEAEGTVAAVEKALGVRFVDVTTSTATYRSFRGTPRLPAALASEVLFVGGLDTRQRYHRRLLSSSGAATVGPQDLRRFYDIDSLHQQGYGGQLSKVALVGSIPDSADQVVLPQVQYFYDAVSNSSTVPNLDTLPLGGSQADNQPGITVELQMDMEMPTVAAPLLQKVTMVEAPADTLFTSAYNEVNENLSDYTAVSTSFGGCEQAEQQGPGATDIAATANLVAQGAAEGIAYFDASGDSGVADCDNEGDSSENFAAVDFPASVPYMVAVGGTQWNGSFDANNAITAYGDEVVWNQEMGQAVGGGGASILFSRPWYQVSPGTNDGGARELPDMALLADITPGVAIVHTAVGYIDNDGNGTSDASPMAAGMFALINDYIGGCRLGSPAPDMYRLGQAQYTGGAAVFHDITSGNITAYGVTGPSAHTGFDEASGLGSLDVAALAAAWPQCPTVPATDAGPSTDAGPTTVDGGDIIWVGGLALDAGPRTAYSPCAAISCADANGTVCTTITEGPAECIVTCDPTGANTCGSGNFCDPFNDGGACEPGCTTNSDCAQADGGGNDVCLTCAFACVPSGNPAGTVGTPCTQDSDCLTGGQCIVEQMGFFTGGYCTAGCSSGSCSCPSGSTCLEADEFCGHTCSVSHGTGCRSGYSCSPLDTTDNGVCLPTCSFDQECEFLFSAGTTCDTAAGGICIPPGVTPPTLTSSTSGSTSSASASTSSTSSSSSSGSTSTSGSTGSAGSSASATASSATASSSGSSGTHSSAASTGSSSSGTTAGTTTASTSGAATTGSTGSASSAGTKKGGCNCEAGASFVSLWSLGALLAFAVSRRRRITA